MYYGMKHTLSNANFVTKKMNAVLNSHTHKNFKFNIYQNFRGHNIVYTKIMVGNVGSLGTYSTYILLINVMF